MPTFDQDYLLRRANQHAICASRASCTEAMIIHRKLESAYRSQLHSLIADALRPADEAATDRQREDAFAI